jgi:hypothetical protein
MPDPDFVGLVQSLTTSANAALGELNALSTRMNRDNLRHRDVAERSLVLLEMLARKTRGNLSRDEADLLTQAIASVRALLERDTVATRDGLS